MSNNQFKNLRKLFEENLNEQLFEQEADIELLKPMMYSLQTGGKRLRPTLLLAVLYIYGSKKIKLGMKTAIALEYIHTYSLIHDDLPAMDNDDLRRGQPTSHKQFDEATAILAGDALLTEAFGLIAEDDQLKPKQRIQLIQELVSASGAHGMVAGQIKDLQSERREISLDELKEIHSKKTGRLFSFSIDAAAIILDLDADVRGELSEFGRHFGLAYQIHNDLKDLTGNQELTGKSGNSDEVNEKNTYPYLLTTKGAVEALADEISQINQIIKKLEKDTGKPFSFLKEFVSYIDVTQLAKELNV
ncbi:polyprenyl synthetase family protein [Aerococcaceae bacterium DSM 111022]|nr:polyprenyl synthetase family protein [Aerococcaceae bacterium DSM 111022]